MARVALPKGSLYNKSKEIVNKFTKGEILKNKLNVTSGDVSFYFLKHRDIPTLIEEEKIDIGITSEEWLVEKKANLKIVSYLDWCNTRISLITKKNHRIMESPIGRTCITEFPYITENYMKKNNINMKIQSISGSSEALVPSIYNYCVDCVETGTTLEVNDLYEEVVLMKSKVVLVVKDMDSYVRNRKIIEDIQQILNEI